jgi:hypothetical protein
LRGAVTVEHRFRIAIVVLAALVVLVWITMDGTKVTVAGTDVDIRWLPSLILGMFAAKAFIHRQAEKMKAEQEQEAVRRQ